MIASAGMSDFRGPRLGFLEAKQSFDVGLQFRKTLSRRKHQFQIDSEILVHDYVAQADDLGPGNRWRLFFDGCAQTAGCFADDLKMMQHPHLHEFISQKLRLSCGKALADVADGFQNIQ